MDMNGSQLINAPREKVYVALNDPEILQAIPTSPGGQMKASDLPVTPKWADIQGMPSAVCSRWAITCSALRTCDDWENPNLDPDNCNVWFVTPEKEVEES